MKHHLIYALQSHLNKLKSGAARKYERGPNGFYSRALTKDDIAEKQEAIDRLKQEMEAA